MGNCNGNSVMCSAHHERAPIRKATILLLGLDNAGKTTVVANLSNSPIENVVSPSIGFSSTCVNLGKFDLSLFDIGGGNQIRDIWNKYFAQAHGFLFVVDATDTNRLEEVRNSVEHVVKDPQVEGKPFLLLANKQDKIGAVDESELRNCLNLNSLVGNNLDKVNVIKSVAVWSGRRGQASRSLKAAVNWLLECIDGHYEEISERVQADIARKRAEEMREKQERAERIRRIREDRERLAVETQKDVGVGGEDDTDDPFKPVEQVIKTIESRERERKAVGTAGRTLGVSPRVEAATDGLGVSSRDGAADAMGTLGMAVINTANAGTTLKDCSLLPSVRLADEPPFVEASENGSFTNSESLTNVTEHISSRSSTPESLNKVVTQSSPSSTVKLQAVRSKEPRSHNAPHGMLLSRLKKRNRTAPAPNPHLVMTDKSPATSLTWVTPVQSADTCILSKLPELPHTHQCLPPVRMTRDAPGMGERSFLLAEDINLPPLEIRVLPTPGPLSSIAT